MTTTTTPAATAAGTPELTIPGICQNLPLDPQYAGPATNFNGTQDSGYGLSAQLLLGETLAHGMLRLGCDDPAYFDKLAEAAATCAAFLRNGRRLVA